MPWDIAISESEPEDSGDGSHLPLHDGGAHGQDLVFGRESTSRRRAPGAGRPKGSVGKRELRMVLKQREVARATVGEDALVGPGHGWRHQNIANAREVRRASALKVVLADPLSSCGRGSVGCFSNAPTSGRHINKIRESRHSVLCTEGSIEGNTVSIGLGQVAERGWSGGCTRIGIIGVMSSACRTHHHVS